MTHTYPPRNTTKSSKGCVGWLGPRFGEPQAPRDAEEGRHCLHRPPRQCHGCPRYAAAVCARSCHGPFFSPLARKSRWMCIPQSSIHAISGCVIARSCLPCTLDAVYAHNAKLRTCHVKAAAFAHMLSPTSLKLTVLCITTCFSCTQATRLRLPLWRSPPTCRLCRGTATA